MRPGTLYGTLCIVTLLISWATFNFDIFLVGILLGLIALIQSASVKT
jgi:hypothetical protein